MIGQKEDSGQVARTGARSCATTPLGFIGDSKKHDQPFFTYIAFNAAHDPRQAPKEYVDMYIRWSA